jgi:Tfp pilus assembly protein FimT
MKMKFANDNRGFSTIQLIITLAIMAIITGFAVMGIVRARANLRLSNSAREFAAHVERARADAVRRHNNAVVQTLNTSTYSVTMDFDNTGTVTTRNFTLREGVVFTTGVKSITFDWRGRIPQEESFGFSNGSNTLSVGITGSGDVTFDAQFFHDGSLPPVALNGPGGSVIPDPGGSPSPAASPTPTPTPTPDPNATPDPNPSPTPTPDPNATPDPNPTPTPNPNPTPTPTPTPDPGPTPTPQPCTIVASPTSMSIIENGSAGVIVHRTNVTGTGTIFAESGNGGQVQVTPSSRSVSGTQTVGFAVTVKKQNGAITFTSAGCTSTTVDVIIRQ